MSLERELEVYKRERHGWIKSGWEGRWVVIKGEEVSGPFDGVEAAMTAGYERYGLDAVFMVRQVAQHDQVIVTSRRAVRVPHSG
jgi:hypothetical protein